MSKKKKEIFDESITNIIDDIKEDIDADEQTKIPDIITFCEDPRWLGLACHEINPISLYPMQKIILKAFYRGSEGNEDIDLSEDEIEKCKELGLVDDDKGNLLEKYENGEIFRELVLVWGRRSSKDFIVSIIALYEAMKLLECPGGDPYALYELSSATTINVLTVANAKDQAHIAFDEIKSKLLNSEYFKDKFVPDGLGASSIYLLTPQDKKDNIRYKREGISRKKGSVGIIVGHSNSDTLLGTGCMVLILDEVASYKTSGGASSGERIYTALTPNVGTYCRRIYTKDEEGNFVLDENEQRIVEKRIYDGKIISISSPRGKEGKFFELFHLANHVPNRLVCRLATWEVNPTHTRESLRANYQSMSETEFNMEFGAEFSGLGVENFFTEEQIKSCFINSLITRDLGQPGKVYFFHLDPATSSHNYALIGLHKEYFLNKDTHKADFHIIVDHIKFWHPTIDRPVPILEVTNYLVGLRRRFHIGLMTYDQFNSQETILKLRKAGIPNKLTRFNFAYKNTIYRELENLMNSHRLKIPYHQHLKNEMEELQRKFDAKGFKVMPKKEGDGAKSDDLCDSLAAACYNAVQRQITRLPLGRTVNTGTSPQSNDVAWRTMQGGVYGVGSGQKVAQQLEKRASWPGYKR